MGRRRQWRRCRAGNSSLIAPQMKRDELQVISTDLTPINGCWYVTTLRPDRRTEGAAYL